MKSSWCSATLLAASLGVAQPVHAGQIELFDDVQQKSTDPSSVLIKYQWGGGGFLLSQDGAKHFSLVCGMAVAPELRGDKLLAYLSGGDAIFAGGYSGLWRGDLHGCGFVAVDALKNRFIAAIAGDPDDPKRVYVTTANGGPAASNGIFTNDGTNDTWAALGALDSPWIQTLHVVKTSPGKRFWATKAFLSPPDPQTLQSDDMAHYFVRYSDDDGVTWTEHELSPITQFGAEDSFASFRLVAVDPNDPDRIYGLVTRDSLPDDLLVSASRGEPGSWSKAAEVTQFGAVAFTPDGKLYFSDADQSTKRVAVIDAPGSAPRTLTNQYVVGCLRWDDSQKRMLACRQWQFGALDLVSGDFNPILDMRCAEHFSGCPGLESTCEAQLGAAWCFWDHYPSAPLCAGYDIPSAKEFVAANVDFDCVDGLAKPRALDVAGAGGQAALAGQNAGSAGTAAPSLAGAAPGGSAGAAMSQTGAPAAAATQRSSSCSVAQVGAYSPERGASLAGAVLGLFLLMRLRRRHPHAQPS